MFRWFVCTFAVCVTVSLAVAADPALLHIDADYMRQSFIDDNAAHWHATTPSANGFFRPDVARNWTLSDPGGSNILVAQPRQIYVNAMAYRLTGDTTYRDTAIAGADFLVNHVKDNTYGGYNWSFLPNGTVVDSAKEAYGQAQVMYAMANLYWVTRDTTYLNAALDVWHAIDTRLQDAHGGYVGKMDEDYSTVLSGPGLNHQMHIFESLIRLYEVAGDESMRLEAQRVGRFMLDTMYRDNPTNADWGYIPEKFDSTWTEPADFSHGGDGYVNLGHSVEMTWLFSRSVELGIADGDNPGEWLGRAEKVLNFVIDNGYHDGGGLHRPVSDYDGNLQDSSDYGTWWEQCELLRAAMHWSSVRDVDLWDQFDATLELVRDHFMDPVYGGWFEVYGGPSWKDYKGSQWKAGYHETMMYMEALRLTAVAGDANGDGAVDLVDLGILATNWGRTDSAGPVHGDYTDEGVVDLSDLGILATHWGVGAEAVPEPATLVLLAAGAACLTGLRRAPL